MFKKIAATFFCLFIGVTLALPAFAAEDAPSQPRLMVTDYRVDGTVTQGGSVVLYITVANKSKTTDITNLKLSFEEPGGGILPQKTNSVYVDKLRKNSRYVWSLSLTVSKNCAGGSYPAVISAEYDSSDGIPCSATETITIAVPEKLNTQDASQPRLMVTDYKIENEYISPDEVRKLSVTIKNTSKTKAVSNIKLSLADETGELRPEGTGTAFVSSVGAGQTYVWVINLTATHTASTGEHSVSVKMEYEDSLKTPYTSDDSLRIAVRQKASLSISGAQLPVKLTQGETVTLNISLMNTGKSKLSNCMLNTDIPHLESGGSVLVGEIESGGTKTGSINLRIDSDFTGEAAGNLTVQYEDEFGQVYEQSFDLSSYIQEKVDFSETEKKEEKKYPLWWLFLLIGIFAGGGIGAAVPIIIFSAKQRKLDEEML